MEALDLNVDGLEDIPGKTITVNGVDYELLEGLGAGAEGFVFPAQNVQSRLVQFVAKVYRCRPGSEQFATTHALTTEAVFSKAAHWVEVTARHSTDGDFVFVQTPETYEIHGGLIQLSEMFANASQPERHADRMARGCRLMAKGWFAHALEVFQDVLRLNASHTEAMRHASVCAMAEGNTDSAQYLLERAIAVEPNDARLYIQLAKVLLVSEGPRPATDALERTLRRWAWDVSTRYIQAMIAVDFGLTELANQRVEDALHLAPQSALFQKLRTDLQLYQERRGANDELMCRADRIYERLASANSVERCSASADDLKDCSELWHVQWRARAARVSLDVPVADHELARFDHLNVHEYTRLLWFPHLFASRHATGIALLAGRPFTPIHWKTLLLAFRDWYENEARRMWVATPVLQDEDGIVAFAGFQPDDTCDEVTVTGESNRETLVIDSAPDKKTNQASSVLENIAGVIIIVVLTAATIVICLAFFGKMR